MATIHLAGGCFWGVEHLYSKLNGVTNTTVGYASAKEIDKNLAEYTTVKTGTTGLRECVKIEYDPSVISMKELLFAYFAVIHTDTPGRQGGDVGDQYQAAIYYTDDAQKAEVMEFAAIEEAALPRGEFAVEIEKLACFYDAEEYHQDYLYKTPGGYCHISPLKMAFIAKLDLKEMAYDKPAGDIVSKLMSEIKLD